MREYLDLLAKIMDEGEDVQTGAYLPSEDRQPMAKCLVGYQYNHDLRNQGFPAVTTKQLHYVNVVKELLWFLRGETNVNTLGCRIWNQWSGPDGDVPHIYGAQWRRWEYGHRIVTSSGRLVGTTTSGPEGIWDQIDDTVKRLKAVAANPFDRSRRRLVVSAWNPPVVPKMGLAPCHTLWQIVPVNGRLDLVAHWRSIDMFTGFPFNISSYATLLCLLAAAAGFEPGVLRVTIADCHIYDNQMTAVNEQVKREPYDPPYLEIDPEVMRLAPDLSVEQCRLLRPEHFRLVGYRYDPQPLKAEVAV
jgi:thymidylate synthase